MYIKATSMYIKATSMYIHMFSADMKSYARECNCVNIGPNVLTFYIKTL
jgi:hypothetical protein